MSQKVDIVEYRFSTDNLDLLSLRPGTTLGDVVACLSVPRRCIDVINCISPLLLPGETFYGTNLSVSVGALLHCVKRNEAYTDLVFSGQKWPRLLVFNAND